MTIKREGGNFWRQCLFMAWAVVKVSRHPLVTKLIKFYTLNLSSFVYVSHTSIRWFKKKKRASSESLSIPTFL